MLNCYENVILQNVVFIIFFADSLHGKVFKSHLCNKNGSKNKIFFFVSIVL